MKELRFGSQTDLGLIYISFSLVTLASYFPSNGAGIVSSESGQATLGKTLPLPVAFLFFTVMIQDNRDKSTQHVDIQCVLESCL